MKNHWSQKLLLNISIFFSVEGYSCIGSFYNLNDDTSLSYSQLLDRGTESLENGKLIISAKSMDMQTEDSNTFNTDFKIGEVFPTPNKGEIYFSNEYKNQTEWLGDQIVSYNQRTYFYKPSKGVDFQIYELKETMISYEVLSKILVSSTLSITNKAGIHTHTLTNVNRVKGSSNDINQSGDVEYTIYTLIDLTESDSKPLEIAIQQNRGKSLGCSDIYINQVKQ